MSFDFDAAVTVPFRMQPGLRRLPPGAAHLTPSRPGARHLREKLAVLQAFPTQALRCAEGFDAAPALAGLARHACAAHPHALRLDGGEVLHAPALGWSVHGDEVRGDDRWPEVGACLRALPPPWRRPALLALAFEEDLAIVDAAQGVIPWLAVALPSHWAPEDKVGRHFVDVHAPVADGGRLREAAPQLLALVAREPWERFVWTVAPQPRLHAHPQRLAPAPWAEALASPDFGAMAWWRTERQTFLPVGRQQAVFTIHVQTRPLAQALTPAQAARLSDAVASMSPAVLAYKGLDTVRAPLLDWLSRRAAA